MTFEDKMLQILHMKDGIYFPHVTGSGSIPNVSASVRNDYDKIRSDGTFHGGVDIIYGKEENGTLRWIGSNTYPNNDLPSVYAPVTGEVINRSTTWGGISILGDGYVHTIYHMKLLDLNKLKVGDLVTAGSTEIGKMSDVNAEAIHVHYEITTYYLPSPVARISKIDPEAFWNNYPASADGFFTLSGSYKIGNQFYGTTNREILKGEGVKDDDQAKYANFNDMDTLSGGGGSDIIDGGTGDDKLFGGNSYGKNQYYNIVNGVLKKTPEVTEDTDTSTDYLIGGEGKDYLDGGKGDDYLYGGVATIANGQVSYDESADTDTSSDTLIGGEGNDVIYGGGGNDWFFGGEDNDTMYGDAGNDVFFGEEGNDTMYGGADDDMYFIEPGDGEDTIEDKQGNNKIYLCGKEINFFYDTGSGQYKSPDGSLTGVMDDVKKEFRVTDDASSTTVVLNDDFQWGDFGTTLITLPTNPNTTNSILGDLTPVDFENIRRAA